MKRFSILLLTFTTACSLAPDAVVPTDRVPQQWRASASTDASAKATRWSDYGSAELERLIAQALANNTDMAAALARVEQARASTVIAGQGLFPAVSASGSANRTTTDSNGTRITSDSSNASLAVAYELDLWQRNRNLRDAAEWNMRATEQDRAALTILVASEVGRLYTGILAFDARIAVAERNLAYAQDVLRITELRYREGAISGLERAQQRTNVANTQAAIVALQNQRALFFNQLAVLCGLAPANLTLGTDDALLAMRVPSVQLQDPWGLLARRPDIAAAEARLRAANINIGVARANALPSLSLGLNAGVVGNPSGTVLGLAASFFAPIFQGGALQAEIDRSTAARDEQTALYQGVLLVAFREVEDALSNLEAATMRREAFKQAADEAQKAEAIARARFDAGSIDYTTLIQTQNARLQADDSYYAAIQAQLAAHIDLVRALGGTTDAP
ncbi:MAG: transporter [Azospirillum brasilense]|nr:MAG: transporter [Azospirillum brasilense]